MIPSFIRRRNLFSNFRFLQNDSIITLWKRINDELDWISIDIVVCSDILMPIKDQVLPQFVDNLSDEYFSCQLTTRLNKKTHFYMTNFAYKFSKKLIEMLNKFKALRKYFHLAPIWHFYLFSFRNGISLSEKIAQISFAIPMKKNKANTYKSPARLTEGICMTQNVLE